jgi:hypothetical protein
MANTTRRDLLHTIVLAAAAPLAATAQTTAGNPLDDARKSVADNIRLVAAVSLAQTVEPAFTFKA